MNIDKEIRDLALKRMGNVIHDFRGKITGLGGGIDREEWDNITAWFSSEERNKLRKLLNELNESYIQLRDLK